LVVNVEQRRERQLLVFPAPSLGSVNVDGLDGVYGWNLVNA